MSDLTFEQAVATAMIEKCFPVDPPPTAGTRTPDPLSMEHAWDILVGVQTGLTEGAKANRHIGWAQAVMCQHSLQTLEFFKGLNAACSALTKDGG